MSSLFHLSDEGHLAEMTLTPYDNENHIQRLIADYPKILAGEQFAGDEPRKWVLVRREMPVDEIEGGEGHQWSLDHLYLDQDGIPTLVEVKRATDHRSRREVVGQMLDYAANGPAMWAIDVIREGFAKTQVAAGGDPETVLADLLGEDASIELYWDTVEQNLRSGRIRMIFVLDQMPAPLLRIVEFLSRQLKDAEIYAVEVKQHVGPSGRILETVVRGQTPEAREKRRAASRQRMSREEWEEKFADRYGEDACTAARKVVDWINEHGEGFITASSAPSYGLLMPGDGPGRYPLFVKLGGGNVAVTFSYLQNTDAFASEEKRQTYIEELKAALGDQVAYKDGGVQGDFRVQAGDLVEDTVLDRFLAVVEKIVAELQAD